MRTERIAAIVCLVIVAGCSHSHERDAAIPASATLDSQPTHLVRTPNQVVIEGVQKYHWGGPNAESSYPGAMAAALQSIGDETTYAYLMGVSGLAFRTQFGRPAGCPSSVHPTCGYDCFTPMNAAVPYNLKIINNPDLPPAIVAAMRAAIRESIDIGYPAIAYSEEADLIVGYKPGTNILLRRAYCDQGPIYQESDKLSWCLVTLTDKKLTPVDKKAAVLHSLRQATTMWDTLAVGKYACGQAAFREWSAYLKHDAAIDSLSEQDRTAAILANAHTFCCLCDARASAEQYLREVAPLFADQPSVQTHLLNAADLYQAEARHLIEKQDPTVTAPYPWMFKPGQKWNSSMRHYQANLLNDALLIERQAIAELSAALRTP